MNERRSPFNRPIALILTLLFIVGWILPAGHLSAQEYDPIAALQERLDRATQNKQQVDGAIAAVKPNITVLEKNLEELEATRERLANLKQKLHAIQFWNAFVGVIGVSMDSLSKVNPGSSAVIATVNFIQDRAGDYLKSKDRGNQLSMRIRNLSATATALSPRVRRVEKLIHLTPQETADLLVSRGMVQNDWLQRWTNTPDQVAQSDSVVTGKITFIQEELGPAISEVDNLISETRALIADLYRELGTLEKEQKRYEEEVHDWQRQLELQGVLKEASKPPKAPPPNPITNPWNGPSMDYGAAASEMTQAWGDLKTNAVDGPTFQARCQAAASGAGKKMMENLKPVSDAYQAASDAFWNHGAWRTEAGWARFLAASAAYTAASNRESQAYESTVTATRKTLDQAAQAEGINFGAFAKKVEAWEKTPLKIRYNYWSFEESSAESTLGQVGYTGESLAWSAWSGASLLDRLLESAQNAPVGPLKGAKDRYSEWQKQVRDAMEKQRQLIANMKTDDNARSGLASEAPALAALLEPNIEVWMYSGIWSSSNYYWWNLRDLYRRLQTYQVTFNALSKAQRAKADQAISAFAALDRKCSEALSAIGTGDTVLQAANRVIETKLKVVQTSRGQLDPGGSTLRKYLEAYGVSRSGIKSLEDVLQQIATPEKLEEHCLSMIPGEKEYNSSWKQIPSEEVLERMRTQYRSMAAKIIGDRQDYVDAYRQGEQAQKTLDDLLGKMRNRFREIEPGQVSFLDRESILQTAQRDMAISDMDRYYLQAVTPDNPDDFADPNFGLQALMDRHRELAGKYHVLVDPMLAKLKTEGRREARLLEKLVEKINAEGPGWMGLSGEDFSARINTISNEANRIYSPLAQQGYAPADSAVTKAYGKFMSRMMEFTSAYYRKLRITQAAAELDRHIADARSFLDAPERLGGRAAAESWIATLDRDVQEKSDMKDSPEIASRLTAATQVMPSLKAYLNREDISQKQKVVDFYASFRQSYEARNDSALVALMSSEWSAEDGTSLSDLQRHFRRIFNLYDEVRYNIQNLNMTKIGPGRYQVTYDVVITSRIYKRNIKREEKSTVSEEVTFDNGGRPRITRTLSGRFWYVQ